MTANEPLAYPFTAQALDLDPRYAPLQREEPAAKVRLPYGGEAWLVTGYDEIKAGWSDPRFSRAATFGRDVPRVTPESQYDFSIMSMDPPEHSRVRRLVAKAFTARRVEELRPNIQRIVDDELDGLVERGQPADLIAGLAFPVPVKVICELLGVPVKDQPLFQKWSDALTALTAYPPEEIASAATQLQEYLAVLAEQRRRAPTDDLLGALVAARDDSDKLSEEELISLGVTVLTVGHETTASHIGNFVYTLLTHPDQLGQLRAAPQTLPTAIDELLRYVPIATSAHFPRIATEDVDLGGVTVRAGEAVLMQPAVGNRDERTFDRPDTLDLTRTPNPHIAFGHGMHHCLGAQLARWELQIVIGSLLRRFPNLRLALPASEVCWKVGRLGRGPVVLPVRW